MSIGYRGIDGSSRCRSAGRDDKAIKISCYARCAAEAGRDIRGTPVGAAKLNTRPRRHIGKLRTRVRGNTARRLIKIVKRLGQGLRITDEPRIGCRPIAHGRVPAWNARTLGVPSVAENPFRAAQSKRNAICRFLNSGLMYLLVESIPYGPFITGESPG